MYSTRNAGSAGTTFSELQQFLDRRYARKVCHNTVAEDGGDCIVVTLHGHPILRFYPGNWVSIHSCGYRTRTTKQRINSMLVGRFRIVQRQKCWYLWDNGNLQPYTEGMGLYVGF